VKKYLTEKGVDAANVVAEGKGSTVPIMDNSTPEGRTANRRVEIEVTFEK